MLENILITIAVSILLLISAVVIFLIYRYHGNRNVKDTKNLEEIIEKAGNKYVNENGNVGLIIGIIKEEKIFIKGFGKTRKDNGEIPNEKTLFELASIGKVFTASVAQILADRSELSFNETIDKYFDSKTKLCEKSQKITLLQLAAHTSGLPSFPKSFIPKIKDAKSPYKDLVIQDLYDYLSVCDEFSKTGNYKYSNLGMGILGHILELKTGKSYENIIKSELTEKLGMQNTTITLCNSQQKILAQGYNKDGEPNPIWENKVLAGAGSFLSNAEDMIKFIKANFDEYQSKISKSLIKTHEPQFSGKTGLGWHYYSKFFGFIAAEKDVVWHNGGSGGYASFIALNKKTRSGVIILSNSVNTVTALGTKLNFMTRNISFSDN